MYKLKYDTILLLLMPELTTLEIRLYLYILTLVKAINESSEIYIKSPAVLDTNLSSRIVYTLTMSTKIKTLKATNVDKTAIS